jgi:hypothetical protein
MIVLCAVGLCPPSNLRVVPVASHAAAPLSASMAPRIFRNVKLFESKVPDDQGSNCMLSLCSVTRAIPNHPLSLHIIYAMVLPVSQIYFPNHNRICCMVSGPVSPVNPNMMICMFFFARHRHYRSYIISYVRLYGILDGNGYYCQGCTSPRYPSSSYRKRARVICNF